MQDDQQQNNQAKKQSNEVAEEVTLEKLQADLDQAMNGWKRALADFENYKRRKEAENQELIAFAKEVTVVKLLPTIDSLEQALRHMPAEEGQAASRLIGDPPRGRETSSKNQEFFDRYQTWQAGINATLRQLDKALEELGVRKIEALGKKFDPHLHEAVREAESDEDDQTVIEELQSGFELNGRVVRPAAVVISKQAASNKQRVANNQRKGFCDDTRHV